MSQWDIRQKIPTDTTLQIVGCLYRLAILFLIRTTFVPDEYFQYVEPSHSVAFGNGIKTWEWEPDHRIRSFVPLLPLIAIYKGLQAIGLDCEWCLHIAPRLLFTLLAICADSHYLRLCKYLMDAPILTVTAAPAHTHNTRSHDHATAATHSTEHVVHHNETFSAAQCAYIIHLLSWSLSYCLPRTLGNSLETCLLVIGTSLLLIPPAHDDYKAHIWNISALARKQRHSEQHLHEYRRLAVAALVIAISVYSRPTALLLWLPLVYMKLWEMEAPLTFIFKTAVPVGLLVLQVSVLVDTHLYGNTLTVAPLQFYAANVSKGYAAYFGVQPWHWNFSQGLPIVLGVNTPVVLYGLMKWRAPSRTIRTLCGVSLAYAVGLSVFSAHQEIRFLLPCLPFLHIVAGTVLCDVLAWCYSDSHRKMHRLRKNLALVAVVLIFVAQLCGVVFLIRYHQCGTEAATALVGSDIRALTAPHQHPHSHSHHHGAHDQLELPAAVNVYIAAPCYSFPGYAGYHLSGAHNSATSSQHATAPVLPALTIHTSPCYLNLDAADHFDTAPERHLSNLLQPNNEGAANTPAAGAAPAYRVDYVLTFDSYYGVLEDVLLRNHFEQFDEIRHAYFRYDLDDPYFKQHVLVFRRKVMSMKMSYEVPSLSTSTTPSTEPAEHAPEAHRDHGETKDTSTHDTDEQHRHTNVGGTNNAVGAEGAHDHAAEQEPAAPAPTVERKHTPFRAFVAAGGTLAAAQGHRLMQDIELEDLLN